MCTESKWRVLQVDTPGGYTIMSADTCLTNNGPTNSEVKLLSLCVSCSSWAVGSVGARHLNSCRPCFQGRLVVSFRVCPQKRHHG